MAKPRPNQEIILRLVQQLSYGNYERVACQVVRLPWNTYQRWMHIGRDARKGTYRTFYLAMREAIANAESKALESWTGAIPHDWRAARDFLERRYPERWSTDRKTINELLRKQAELEAIIMGMRGGDDAGQDGAGGTVADGQKKPTESPGLHPSDGGNQ